MENYEFNPRKQSTPPNKQVVEGSAEANADVISHTAQKDLSEVTEKDEMLLQDYIQRIQPLLNSLNPSGMSKIKGKIMGKTPQIASKNILEATGSRSPRTAIFDAYYSGLLEVVFSKIDELGYNVYYGFGSVGLNPRFRKPDTKIMISKKVEQ